MELTTCARPFARAAFHYAKKRGLLSEWSKMLSLYASVARHKGVIDLLSSPALSKKQRADAFFNLCDGGISEGGVNFIRILSENKRISLLPVINVLFEQLKLEEERLQVVNITSAFPLTQSHIDKLAKKIEIRLGYNVKLNIKVDSDLMGGLVIRVGDLVIDDSLQTKLKRLGEVMSS